MLSSTVERLPLVGDGLLRDGVAGGGGDPEQEVYAIEGQQDQSECQQRKERLGTDQAAIDEVLSLRH